MLKYGWIIALGLVAILIAYVGYGILLLSGATRAFEPKLVDQCHRVDIAPGTEDIQFDPDTGLAFISADNRRATGAPDAAEAFGTTAANGIYALDVTTPRLHDIGNPVKVSPDNLTDFRPHGLYLWRGDAGQKRLFVVNHPTTGEEIIEIFEVGDSGALQHLESVSFPEMYSPNDVVAVGPNAFYATNDVIYDEGFLVTAEVLLALPVATAVYYDGETGRTVARGLAFGNGINLSPDGAMLYIAEWTRQRISVFDRQPNGDLSKVKSIGFPTAVDNLDVDEDGHIWFGGQPNLFEFAAAGADPDAVAKSVGIKVDPVSAEYETVFAALAGEINAASIVAAAGDRLLVGAVFDGHILVCPKSGAPA